MGPQGRFSDVFLVWKRFWEVFGGAERVWRGFRRFSEGFSRFLEDFRRVRGGRVLRRARISGPLRKVGSVGKEVSVGK